VEAGGFVVLRIGEPADLLDRLRIVSSPVRRDWVAYYSGMWCVCQASICLLFFDIRCLRVLLLLLVGRTFFRRSMFLMSPTAPVSYMFRSPFSLHPALGSPYALSLKAIYYIPRS